MPIQFYRGVNLLSSNTVANEVVKNKSSALVYTDSFNKRIRIDEYAGDLNDVLDIISQQISDWVEKLIVKTHSTDVPFFIANGFSCEAFVKGYFAGADMFFVTKYFSPGREQSKKWHEEQEIIQKLIADKSKLDPPSPDGIKIATQAQAHELANLYREVFKVYPTPLGDEEHIRQTMIDGTVYVYLENNNQIVSVASAEVNWKLKNAELTDCATTPQAEGKGHMKKLLFFLEQKLRSESITCFYSIARSESYSMNKAFAQLGFTYGGRLVNNCFICSGIEDMNVWYLSVL